MTDLCKLSLWIGHAFTVHPNCSSSQAFPLFSYFSGASFVICTLIWKCNSFLFFLKSINIRHFLRVKTPHSARWVRATFFMVYGWIKTWGGGGWYVNAISACASHMYCMCAGINQSSLSWRGPKTMAQWGVEENLQLMLLKPSPHSNLLEMVLSFVTAQWLLNFQDDTSVSEGVTYFVDPLNIHVRFCIQFCDQITLRNYLRFCWSFWRSEQVNKSL